MTIFVSVNAVVHFFQGLEKAHIDWPMSMTVFAIGDATARSLADYHHGPIHQPLCPDSEHLLELALLQPQNISGSEQKSAAKLLVVSGLNGRRLIPDVLKQRGAHVHTIAVYERRLPEINLDFSHALWQDDAIDVITVFSETALHNVFLLFEEAARSWIQSKPCVVISPRLAQAAYAAGIKTVVTTSYANLLTTLATMAYNHG